MEKEFYKFIYQQQKETETVPPNEQIATWVLDLICLLFPEDPGIHKTRTASKPRDLAVGPDR